MPVKLRVLAAAVLASALIAACGGSTPAGPLGPRGALPSLGSLASSGAGHRFYEVYDAAGPARGTLLLLHGGGWLDSRGDARSDLATTALAFRAVGWRVVNVSYSPAREPGQAIDPRPMLRDVVAFYDQIHRAYPGPICAFGESAGAYLAMLLAIERPSLTCAVDEAGPLDLPVLLKKSAATGEALIRAAFGTDPATLRDWSPDRVWQAGVHHTAVFATYAANDEVVPTSQLDELAQLDSHAQRLVIPGADVTGGIPWLHSVVDRAALFASVSTLEQWLDRLAPRPSKASPPAAGAVAAGADCMTVPSDRSQLLLGGSSWQQTSTQGPIAATRGCSGSAQWQDDGLSLWALPQAGTLPFGGQATLTFTSPQALRLLSARFRGFLARPQQWTVGLYASNGTPGATPQAVADCATGTCTGLRLVPTASGALIAAAGSTGDPDAQATPPLQTFALPAGTRTVAWVLRCSAPSGCSLAGINPASGPPTRPRDPLGQPAIFSLYQLSVS